MKAKPLSRTARELIQRRVITEHGYETGSPFLSELR